MYHNTTFLCCATKTALAVRETELSQEDLQVLNRQTASGYKEIPLLDRFAGKIPANRPEKDSC
jgi:hypothetical protein